MNGALVNVMFKTDHIEMKTFSESLTRNWCLFTFRNILENWIPVVLKRENAIHQINHYPLTKYKLTSHSSVNNGARPACVAGGFFGVFVRVSQKRDQQQQQQFIKILPFTYMALAIILKK